MPDFKRKKRPQRICVVELTSAMFIDQSRQRTTWQQVRAQTSMIGNQVELGADAGRRSHPVFQGQAEANLWPIQDFIRQVLAGDILDDAFADRTFQLAVDRETITE